LPKGLPSLVANLDTGHTGTYFAKQGGKTGKAAVAFLNWQFKNNATARSWFLDIKSSPLVVEGWHIKSKNWN
jgi:hypothetical protein